MQGKGLVLFDIDGTLLRRSGPHHRDALVDAVKEVTGLRTTTDGIPLHGMLDHEIVRLMMVAACQEEAAIRESLPRILEAAQRLYLGRGGPELSGARCPGVPRLLNQLREADVPLGIVSGNLEAIGWEKLRRAGLRGYFEFGAFAGMGPTRTVLARLALEEGRRRGYGLDGRRVSLVGDSLNDILAARQNELFAVGVATGMHTVEQLKEAGADLALADLAEVQPGELMPAAG